MVLLLSATLTLTAAVVGFLHLGVVPVDNATTIYLETGAVNVGLVAIIVEGLVTLLKPFIDSWLNPSDPKTAPRHDALIEVLILALTVGGALAFQAAGPMGLHSGASAVALAVQVILALFVEWGIYLKLRGNVPVTPTPAFLDKVAARHGDLLAARLAPMSSNVGGPQTVNATRPGFSTGELPPSNR